MELAPLAFNNECLLYNVEWIYQTRVCIKDGGVNASTRFVLILKIISLQPGHHPKMFLISHVYAAQYLQQRVVVDLPMLLYIGSALRQPLVPRKIMLNPTTLA